jgi:carboxypeptidase Q
MTSCTSAAFGRSMRRLMQLLPSVVVAHFGLVCQASAQTDLGPESDGTQQRLVAIGAAGMMHTVAYQWLTELSDDIGPRVTGSPAARKAVAWGVEKMKSIGLTNVHTEQWTLPKGWTRGKSTAEMIAPLRRPLYVSAMGWTGSTPGDVEADVMPANLLKLDELTQDAARFRGKIVVMTVDGALPANPGPLIAQYCEFAKAVQESGAVALIGGQGGAKEQGMHLTHTGAVLCASDFKMPVLSIAAEDQGQIERLVARGQAVRLRLNVQNTFTSGPVPSENVVGEIQGSEKPEQILVVGAHLDSWDLATGSTDDGTGVCTVLAAASAIQKSGVRPRRTLRFVLFTGEEQGTLGSKAYTRLHAGELQNHVAAMLIDSGQGPIVDVDLGRTDVVARFAPFANALRGFRELKFKDRASFGTDSGPFILVGLPGITFQQDSPEYRYTIHSAADTLDTVKPDVLAQNASIMAITAFWLADRPERFAAPWPPEKTARMLRDQGAYERLNSSGQWPFGELGADSPATPNPK